MPLGAKWDFTDLREPRRGLRGAVPRILFKATNRAVELTRDESPGGREGLIGKAITKDFDYGSRPVEGVVIADAAVKRRATNGVLHLPSGKTKDVELKGSGVVNVAELVAEGTGLFGPRGSYIEPLRSRVLLIRVDEVPAGSAYIEAAGEKFIMRPRSSGMRPDDYPARAVERLDAELDALADEALAEVLV